MNSRSTNWVALAGAIAVIFWSIMAAAFPNYHPTAELVSAVSVVFNTMFGYLIKDTPEQIDAAHADLHSPTS
jgi:hypothetical protein